MVSFIIQLVFFIKYVTLNWKCRNNLSAVFSNIRITVRYFVAVSPEKTVFIYLFMFSNKQDENEEICRIL